VAAADGRDAALAADKVVVFVCGGRLAVKKKLMFSEKNWQKYMYR
jgi:hypothetical protein